MVTGNKTICIIKKLPSEYELRILCMNRPCLQSASFFCWCFCWCSASLLHNNGVLASLKPQTFEDRFRSEIFLITQPSFQLSKLAEPSARERGDVRAHFAHQHYVFSLLAKYEDYKHYWWITELRFCV